MILALQVYHGDFKMGYNVAKATEVDNSSWLKIGMVVENNQESDRSKSQCTIPVEKIVMMEAIDILSS